MGESKELSFTVENIGGRTLRGTATTNAPFSIVSGGSFSLRARETQDVIVRFSPTSTGTFNEIVNFRSNGGDIDCSVTGVGIQADTPPPLPTMPLM